MQRRTPLTPIPKQGDSKSSLHFAYLPHSVGDIRVWLERYEVLYVYKAESIESVVEGKVWNYPYGTWIKVTERLINKRNG